TFATSPRLTESTGALRATRRAPARASTLTAPTSAPPRGSYAHPAQPQGGRLGDGFQRRGLDLIHPVARIDVDRYRVGAGEGIDDERRGRQQREARQRARTRVEIERRRVEVLLRQEPDRE